MASIHESTTLKISAMAKKLTASGLDIIDMGVGEPDFDTPKHIVEAGCNSIRMGETHYAPTAGIPELRQAIADKLCSDNSLNVTADECHCNSWRKDGGLRGLASASTRER